MAKSGLFSQAAVDRVLGDSPPPADTASEDVPAGATLLSTLSPEEVREHLHRPGTELPPVRPCDTAGPCDSRTRWTAEELHIATGARKFKNYQHLLQCTENGKWVDGGEFPASLGSYTSVRAAKRGKPIDPHLNKYLDVVHLDIGFGDCTSVGGNRYVIVFVDRATRYNWVFGLKTLSAEDVRAAFLKFRAEAGGYARSFRCDCDTKLVGQEVRKFLSEQHSTIRSSGAHYQSGNGLVEAHWKTMVHMSRAYLTEKQMPRRFWFYSIRHAAQMMNHIPGKYKGKLATPHMLVHGVKGDCRCWAPLFSVCYFKKDEDTIDRRAVKRSKNQAHSMDGIIVGRSETSNSIIVYNPRNKQFYDEIKSYNVDPYRLPACVYSSFGIKYDGGLFCHLKRDGAPPQSEEYPPGTRVERAHPRTRIPQRGTVMDIPMPSDEQGGVQKYIIQYDDGTSSEVDLSDMPSIAQLPPASPVEDDSKRGLPPWLFPNSKVTYEYQGEYHKGYIGVKDGVYRFSYKRHPNVRDEEWGVELRDFPSTWVQLNQEGVLLPGHDVSSFRRDAADPVASIVSAANLHSRDVPSSLLQALADDHPDREVWLQSFYEEKNSIESMNTYRKITLGEYRALREKGAPKAIPTMCVLTVKRDESMMPVRAKSRIVVLGNHEDRQWSKPERFAPVLRGDSLRFLVSMAVDAHRVLKQGDCKNAFCQGELPADEVTIVRPPKGDPSAKPGEFWLLRKCLYGLRRSPRHWYEKIDGFLRKMGLVRNPYDPCVYSGFVSDPDDPSDSPSSEPLVLGLYVDDFVYFSASDEVEAKFQRILSKMIDVEFMGVVEWFLGTQFTWRRDKSETACHMCQAGFSRNLVEQFGRADKMMSPDATPYRSGLPIDSIASADPEDKSDAFLRRRDAYRSLVGSVGWLACCTRPDLAPVHSFLASYSNCPAVGHMKAAIYALHYIHSTHDYGITFTSKESQPIHSYLHFPHKCDAEAYEDPVAPSTTDDRSRISTYGDACWGSQIGNALPVGTPVEMFKFRSMSGAIVFRMSGPIAWGSDRQEKTSLSSCEAEIKATNLAGVLTVATRNFSEGFAASGIHLKDGEGPIAVYNDNEACVKWCYNMTSKNIRHMELKDNSVREWCNDGTIKVLHVAGKCNVSDIFTKEIRDKALFRRLRDAFMTRLSDFVRGRSSGSHPVPPQ